MRLNEARKNAGDPGPVLARRLSNAEYNYTIRDLTGVDIRPAREFPVDPANLAGFDNSGESLTMSPALLKKYLQAAREVGDHMVLTPDGFDFAPLSDARRDRSRQVHHPTDRGFLRPAAHRLRRLLSGCVALQVPRRARQARCHAGEHRGGCESEREVSADGLADPRGSPRTRRSRKSARSPSCRRCGALCRRPAGSESQAAEVRAKCVEMRDFVVRSGSTRRCSSRPRSCEDCPPLRSRC